MAAKDLPPVPHQTPMLDDQGFLTPPWAAWFRQIYFRVGGSVAKTNLELDSAGGVTSVGTLDGQPASASGATVVGSSLFFQAVTAAFAGLMTIGTQVIAGAKTFAGSITASNLSGTNSGDLSIGSFGSAPDAKGATQVGQVITFQPGDATHPGMVSTTAQSLAGRKTCGDGVVVSKALVEAAAALADATTIVVDANLSNTFQVTLGGNRTMGNPSNSPAAGFSQKVIFQVKQDGTGSRTLAWDTKYRFSTDLPLPTLTTTANKMDQVGFIYNQVDDKWDCVAVNKGF